MWPGGCGVSVDIGRQLILSGCTYEASVNLLWTPHNLASVGALRAQIPTCCCVKTRKASHNLPDADFAERERERERARASERERQRASDIERERARESDRERAT